MEPFQKMSLRVDYLFGKKMALKLRDMKVGSKMVKLLVVVQSLTKMEVPTKVK